MTIDPEGDYNWSEPPASQKGEWLYLKGQNVFEDLLALVEDTEFFNLRFLAALVLMKARIIQKHEIAKEKNQTPLPFDESVLQVQKQHLEKFLNLIHDKNPYFLKAVVNPGVNFNNVLLKRSDQGRIKEFGGPG